ncbi:uncharacterized protein TM35_000292180 [Trypanosoma theileri]|uniref:C2H2-type domain-containing protein n=1 Tax=Trypanosoma theileri TaxID=67003 RepID=A0A1X0NNP2_9TRYP|nr:uncharacterized protein TM35_000292180 [Trypanosoma theileri]ORC86336.1 hypothetical protein TM35_000292180 [Trypanosoma theileri]
MAATSFEFVQGSERLDWGVLVAIDLQRLIKDTNVDTLQRIVENLAFARVTRDEAAMFTPEHILHLFTLCQLVIQYLVCSQECLAKMNVKLSERVQEAQHRWNSAEAERERLHEENTILRKEVKAQRRTLLAYEYANSNAAGGGAGGAGVGCPYVCPHCGDAYAKSESLQSHIRKRHQKQPAQQQSQQQQQQQQQVGKTTDMFEMHMRQLQEKVDRLEQQLGREKERNDSLQRESMMMMLQATMGGARTAQQQQQEKEKEEQRVVQIRESSSLAKESPKREETLASLPRVHTAPVQVITPEVSAIPIMPDVEALQRYNVSRQQESTNHALLRQIAELEKVVRDLKNSKKETVGTDIPASSHDSKQSTMAPGPTTTTTTTTQAVSHTPSWLSAPGRGVGSTTMTSTLPVAPSTAERVALSTPQPTQTLPQQQQQQQQSYVSVPPVPTSNTTTSASASTALSQPHYQPQVSVPPVPASNTTTSAPVITPQTLQQPQPQQQSYVSVPPVPTSNTTTGASASTALSQPHYQPQVSVPPVPASNTTSAPVITPQTLQQPQQQQQQHGITFHIPPTPAPSLAPVSATGIKTVGSTVSTFSTSSSSVNMPHTSSTTAATTNMQHASPAVHGTALGSPSVGRDMPTRLSGTFPAKGVNSDPSIFPWNLPKQPSNSPGNPVTTSESTPIWLRTNSMRDDSSKDGSTIAANPPRVGSGSINTPQMSVPPPVSVAPTNTQLTPSGLQMGRPSYADVASTSRLPPQSLSPQVPVPSSMATIATGGIPSYSNAVTVSASGVPHAAVPVARQARAPSNSTSSSRSSSYESTSS